MIFIVDSPAFTVTYLDGKLEGDVDALNEFMADNDNTIDMPSWGATLQYRKRDPQSIYWAARMFAETLTPGEVSTKEFEFDAEEPDYSADIPRRAVI
jgi:hypothetical protein